MTDTPTPNTTDIDQSEHVPAPETLTPTTLVRWAKAAGIRAVKTAAQSALGAIPVTALTIGGVDWRIVAGTAALAGVASLLTSVKGLPEVDNGASLTTLTA